MPIATPDRDRPSRRRKRIKGPPTPAPRAARPVGVFARPPVPPRTPIQRQVVKAQGRTRAAQRRLPARPVPHVPIIRNPTPKQTQAAKQAITVGIKRAVGPGGSGAQRQQRRASIEQELRTTPQGRALLRAASHYGLAEIRQRELARGVSLLQRPPGALVLEAPQRGPLPGFDIAPRGLTAKEVREIGRADLSYRLQRDTVAAGPRRALGGRPHALMAAIMAQTSLGGASAENEFFKAAGRDVQALGTAPFVGAYEVGSAGVSALTGNLDPAKRLASGAWEGAKQSVPGQLLQGDPAGALEEFRKHPVMAALDVTAVGAVAGRGAGAVARGLGKKDAPGVRGQLADFGSTVRPPIALTHDPAAVRAGAYKERSFSKDSIRKSGQRVADSAREVLRDSKGRPVMVSQRGKMVPVLKPLHDLEAERHNRREGDLDASGANARERQDRDMARHEASVRGRLKRRGVRGRGAQDLVMLVTEGTIRSAKTFEADVDRELSRLKKEHKERLAKTPANVRAGRDELSDAEAKGAYRHKGEVALAERQINMLEGALRNPRVAKQHERIVAEGERLGKHLNETEAKQLRLGVLSNEQRARRSGLFPVAITHGGARHVSRQEHAKMEREALAREDAALEKLDAAQRAPLAERRPKYIESLRKEYIRAREDRLAVSGREPGKQSRHEHWKREEERRGNRRKMLAAKHASLWSQRQRIIGSQAVRRGQAQGAPTANRDALIYDAVASGRKLGPAIRNHPGLSDMSAGSAHARAYELVKRGVLAYDPGDGFTVKGPRPSGHVRGKGSEKAARSAERGAKKLAEVDAKLAKVRAEMKDARKEHHEAKQKLKQNPEGKQQGGLRTAEGRYLSNKDIERHLTDVGRDPGTVAYLPHRQDILGRRAFHSRFDQNRPVADAPESRTGEAYRKGARAVSREVLEEQGVRQAVQLAKAGRIDALVRDAGARHPAFAKAQAGEKLTRQEQRIVDGGGYFTMREALEYAQRLEWDDDGRPILEYDKLGNPILHGPNGERLVPMRAYAGRLSDEAKHIIREGLQGPGGMETLGMRLLNDRVMSVGDLARQERNVVLVPAARVEQLQRHLRPASEIEKFFQMLNKPFRFAVLAQPRWLAGNFIEPTIRLTTVGSGVNVFGLARDLTAAHKTLKIMEHHADPRVRDAAAQIRAQHFGGLFIGGRGASVRRSAEELPVIYGKVISRLPVVREGFEMLRLVGRALMAPGNAYFRFNRVIEGVAQRAALGRDVTRDLQEFTGSWTATLRLQKSALEEVAQGLVNTPTQRRFLRSQHEMLGKYEGFPPWLRRLTQTIMPFLPWALNAARFVYWTMPAHRTIQTALLVKVNDVVAKEWQEVHANVPPGTLRLAIPTKKGGWVDLARYTPYGLTAPVMQGELGGLTDQIAPQFSGAYAALGGKDPFDRPLQTEAMGKEGRRAASGGEKIGAASYGLAEALIPYVAQIRRIREGGGTAFAGSTVWDPDVKPGTDFMSGWRRTFDPFRPTYLSPPTSGKRGKGLRLDEGDKREIREAIRGADIPPEDLDEIRALIRGG